ncbi:Serine/threonine-protein kinase [Ceratobasidium sp. AG-Ba]|nr:Serine/threonine-protein kinase [Ceratobasidium sp. AG-Ba]
MYFNSEDEDSGSSFSGVGAYDDTAAQKLLNRFANDQILTEGIHATIYKIDTDNADGAATGAGLRAVKLVSAFKNARLEPHDIRSEVHVLARLSHPNIIQLLEASYSHQQKIYQITMPIPQPAPKRALQYSALAKSFLYQITSALAYLHAQTDEHAPIAHRDLKPSNILVPSDGCIKLIDFGISWEDRPRGHGASFQEPRGLHDNGRLNGFSDAPKPDWDETPESMCCQVSSGPYRALELLFAPRRYDALAVDLWSLGVLASGFFTSLAFKPKGAGAGLREFDWDALIPEGTTAGSGPANQSPPEPDPTVPFNSLDMDTSAGGTWYRIPIFDSTRGEIGLIASVFKVLGTPTDTSWPGFKSLPAASALVFNPVSPRPLKPLLPNIPPSHAQSDDRIIGACLAADGENAVKFIEQLVCYPPESRTKAVDLLRHAYFTEGCTLVLPSTLTPAGQPLIQGGLETLPELISIFSANVE